MSNDARIERIKAELHDVYDPEIPVNIYDLGLVYSIDVDEKNLATIVMTLTAPGCPVADMIVQQVYDKAMNVDGVDDCFVEQTVNGRSSLPCLNFEAD